MGKMCSAVTRLKIFHHNYQRLSRVCVYYVKRTNHSKGGKSYRNKNKLEPFFKTKQVLPIFYFS